MARLLWERAESLGMTSESYVWFGSDSIAGRQFIGDLNATRAFHGTFFVLSYVATPRFEMLGQLWKAHMRNTLIPEFETLPVCGDGVPCRTHELFNGWDRGLHDKELQCVSYTALAYDAVIALVVAADRIITRTGKIPQDFNMSDWQQELLAMKDPANNFTCMTGDIFFDENQDRQMNMAIKNHRNGSLIPDIAAIWSRTNGFEWEVGQQVVWPGTISYTITEASRAPFVPSGEPPPCAEGTVFNLSVGSCQACAPGKYSDVEDVSTECKTCRIGHVTKDRKSCVSCEEGSQPSMNGSACETCPEGRSGDGDYCRPCEVGFFSPKPGQRTCDECPLGTTSEMGSTVCEPCIPGTAAEQPGYCEPCVRGLFQDEDGQAICKACPVGRFQPDQGKADCESCDNIINFSTTQLLGAFAPDSCVCAENHLWLHDGNITVDVVADGRPHPSGRCEPCHSGLLCKAGRGEPLQAAGFFSIAPKRGGLRPKVTLICRSVAHCPEGLKLGECPPHREGDACDFCEIGYAPDNEGNCKQCETWDFLRTAIIGWFCLLAAVGIAFIVIRSKSIVSQSVLTLGATCSLLAGTVQSLGVFQEFSISWTSPFATIMPSLRLLSLDVTILKLECFFPIRDAFTSYMLSLFAYPFALLSLALLLGTLRLSGCKVFAHTFSNAEGIVLQITYIALCATTLKPFACDRNPDGTSSVVTFRSVRCWTTGEHAWMIAISIINLLVFVIGYLAVVVWATLQYSSWIGREGGVSCLKHFDFIFKRYKASCYYYAVCHSFRNLLVSLVPVFFASFVEMQILMSMSVISLFLLLQTRIFPWHVQFCNVVDTIIGFVLTIIIVIGGLHASTDRANGSIILEVGGIASVSLSAILLLAGFINGVYRYCFPWQRYGIFLSHHKGAAQILARWFKLVLSEVIADEIFLDSDQLDILPSLLATVAFDTSNVVVLLSKETLSRMWCACEVVTAYNQKVNMVLLRMEDYVPPADNYVEQLWQSWDDVQRAELVLLGITMADIEQAYNHVSSMPTMYLKRPILPEAENELIADVLKNCTKLHRKALSFFRTNRATSGDLCQSQIMLVANQLDPEASCCCQVVLFLLQRELQQEVSVASKDIPELRKQIESVQTVIVLLTRGVLSNPLWARQVVLVTSKEAQVETIPVVADSSFGFPGAEFWANLAIGRVIHPEEPEIADVSLEDITFSYRMLLSVIAMKFTEFGSEIIQKAEICQISRRLRDREKRGAWVKERRISQVAHIQSMTTMTKEMSKPVSMLAGEEIREPSISEHSDASSSSTPCTVCPSVTQAQDRPLSADPELRSLDVKSLEIWSTPKGAEEDLADVNRIQIGAEHTHPTASGCFSHDVLSCFSVSRSPHFEWKAN
eukprot:TRINITY_DN6005_c0_g2_i3.p1 TRINITY_DN6005_c0_g2~~TRINITY_DN6005_c0_g2_i3.p1  ORF type:complete len:1600 (+),score=217.88 TRINITY_DN6005_c0_g2_i3:684-4802(+)